MAQTVRFVIALAAMLLAGTAFMELPPGWGWLVALAVFGAGGVLAERAFRRLATQGEIGADLEDRVRHLPD